WIAARHRWPSAPGNWARHSNGRRTKSRSFSCQFQCAWRVVAVELSAAALSHKWRDRNGLVPASEQSLVGELGKLRLAAVVDQHLADQRRADAGDELDRLHGHQ